jgi:hypothetical protein
MANYAIGLGFAGIGALALSGSGTTAAAAPTVGTEMYFFRDYSWCVLMPSTSDNLIQPGPLNSAILKALPPPPGLKSATGGMWAEYPRGYRSAYGHLRGGGTAPGAKGNPIFPAWPDIPAGLSLYQWITPYRIATKVTGYFIYHDSFVFDDPATIAAASGVLAYAPKFHWEHPVPPPPGESAHSGGWFARQPGVNVWLTPANTNPGTLTVQTLNDPALAQFLMTPGTGGGISASEPTLMPSYAQPYA